MKLDYDNKRTQCETLLEAAQDIQQKSPLELLQEFYQKQNGQPMKEIQQTFVQDLIESIWEDEECDH